MSAEDLEKYETEMELTLYREYRDVVGIFKYVVETDRRFYLCNQVDVKARSEAGEVFFEVSMSDAWVWDMYRPARFAKNVKVLTFKDVNVEELSQADIDPPKAPDDGLARPGCSDRSARADTPPPFGQKRLVLTVVSTPFPVSAGARSASLSSGERVVRRRSCAQSVEAATRAR